MFDDSIQHVTSEARRRIVELAMQGGYFDSVMRAGDELARMKDYLQMLAGQRAFPPAVEGNVPTIFPPYPGLEARAWRELPHPTATALEGCLAAVERDLARLENVDLLHYDTPAAHNGRWTVHPVFFAGARLDRLFSPGLEMEETAAAVQSLEGECSTFPLGDVLFSAHSPGMTLSPHCSWDGFRMRLHLGLRIPEGCGIRVGTEARTWQQGRAMVFHDSFEHETWNHSQERRMVLIVDCWDPGLTLPEREALLGLTRKFEVRSLLAQLRIPDPMVELLLKSFAQDETTDPYVHRFWRM